PSPIPLPSPSPAPVPVPTPSGEVFTGDGTAYSEAVSNQGGIGFACSYRYLNDYFKVNFAAINQPMWNDGANCGRCLVATCVDPQCRNGQTVLVQVVDLCPECKYGDVDFSIPTYNRMTGLWPNRLKIQWSWNDDCANMITGTIQFSPKDGVNDHWQAFYLSNAKFPIASVALNGVPLQRSPYQFYINPASPPSGPATLTITATNGQVATATLNNIFQAQDLGVNFA
ncbi:hypothetical protein H632_c1928p0, partial [Helicosporidium sp. ATCC 50920]